MPASQLNQPPPAQPLVCVPVEQARRLADAALERDQLTLAQQEWRLRELVLKAEVRREQEANSQADTVIASQQSEIQAASLIAEGYQAQAKHYKVRLVKAKVVQVIEVCIIGVLFYLLVSK